MSKGAELAAPVKRVLEQEMGLIYDGTSPEKFNEAFVSRNGASLPHRLAGKSFHTITHSAAAPILYHCS